MKKWKEARSDWAIKEDWKTKMLQQKTRVKWDIEGDENSSFFHRSVRRKGGRKCIKGLLVDGVWREDPNVIKNKYLISLKICSWNPIP